MATDKLKVQSWDWGSDFTGKVLKGVVFNDSDHRYSLVTVEFNIYDKDHVQIGSALDNVANLEPHEKWSFKAMVLEPGAVEARLIGVEGY
jgi:hypothetical protein